MADQDFRRPVLRRRRGWRWLVLLAGLVAGPAVADVCDDLWFTRNLIMDRAGYCFGTTLGKAVFDNADCTGKTVDLTSAEQKLVATIRTRERALECKLDTRSRQRLDLPDIATRFRLRDLPLADEFESGCIGWREPSTPLFAGRDPDSRIVGRIEPGDNVHYGHWNDDPEPWVYVTVWDSQFRRLRSAGWLGLRTNEQSCRNWAG